MISDGYKMMLIYPYQLIIPALLFAVLMISLNLVADGLRDALDSKMKDM
jgi:oligopeptide transport system permease protein